MSIQQLPPGKVYNDINATLIVEEDGTATVRLGEDFG